jgi:hypothetical protein
MFGHMGFEHPENERGDGVAASLGSIMTFKEYRELEHPTPYVFESSKGGLELLYFGAKHIEDPEDPMFDEIKSRFETFAKNHSPENSLVVIEGGLRPDNADEESARRSGEPGFTQYLAREKNYEVASPEPADREIFGALVEAGYAKEDIAVAQFVMRFNYAVRTQKRNPTMDDIEHAYFECEPFLETGWAGELPSNEVLKKLKQDDPQAFERFRKEVDRRILERLEARFSAVTGKRLRSQAEAREDEIPVDPKLVEAHDDPADAAGVGSPYVAIHALTSELRDRAIVRTIGQALAKGKSVFTVYGASHAVMQEPALKKIMETL